MNLNSVFDLLKNMRENVWQRQRLFVKDVSKKNDEDLKVRDVDEYRDEKKIDFEGLPSKLLLQNLDEDPYTHRMRNEQEYNRMALSDMKLQNVLQNETVGITDQALWEAWEQTGRNGNLFRKLLKHNYTSAFTDRMRHMELSRLLRSQRGVNNFRLSSSTLSGMSKSNAISSYSPGAKSSHEEETKSGDKMHKDEYMLRFRLLKSPLLFPDTRFEHENVLLFLKSMCETPVSIGWNELYSFTMEVRHRAEVFHPRLNDLKIYVVYGNRAWDTNENLKDLYNHLTSKAPNKSKLKEREKILFYQNVIRLITDGVSLVDRSFPFSKIWKMEIKTDNVSFKKTNVELESVVIKRDLETGPFYTIMQDLLDKSWLGESPSQTGKIAARFLKNVEKEMKKWEHTLMSRYARYDVTSKKSEKTLMSDFIFKYQMYIVKEKVSLLKAVDNFANFVKENE